MILLQDHHITVTARKDGQAEEQAAALRAEGLSAEGLRLDLANPGDIAHVADHIHSQYGRLDALINNASCMPEFDKFSMLDADIDYVRTALEVNVVGVWALVKATAQLLQAAPAARAW